MYVQLALGAKANLAVSLHAFPSNTAWIVDDHVL